MPGVWHRTSNNMQFELDPRIITLEFAHDTIYQTEAWLSAVMLLTPFPLYASNYSDWFSHLDLWQCFPSCLFEVLDVDRH